MNNAQAPFTAESAYVDRTASDADAHPCRARQRSIERLPNHRVLSELLNLNRQQRRFEAELLLFLGELDRRQLYREQAVSSAFAYCVQRLGYSEDVAYKRVGAARLLRQFPAIFEWIADGRVHLTALMLIKPQLTEDDHEHWLSLVCGKSKTAGRASRRVALPAPRCSFEYTEATRAQATAGVRRIAGRRDRDNHYRRPNTNHDNHHGARRHRRLRNTNRDNHHGVRRHRRVRGTKRGCYLDRSNDRATHCAAESDSTGAGDTAVWQYLPSHIHRQRATQSETRAGSRTAKPFRNPNRPAGIVRAGSRPATRARREAPIRRGTTGGVNDANARIAEPGKRVHSSTSNARSPRAQQSVHNGGDHRTAARSVPQTHVAARWRTGSGSR